MSILEKVIHYVDLKSEVEDFDFIHSEIEKGVVFKGTNLWILFFSIIVASVGLNTNSTAVIIGAMLISPLLGPINGIGYSLATYNFDLFKKSIKNFSFAVLTGLTASTLYFIISPVSTAHSELLARTSPTIYDVLIALFGGLAGIVAISSKLKGNVIPGVAIATALMPPLCTAGYGLGTGQFNFFFGAIYLFTINTVFIAISSVIISQVLKFPIRTVVGVRQRNKINRYISLVIIITLLPSIYFGYVLVINEKFSENASKFTNSMTFLDGSYLLKSETNPGNRTIKLIYGGNLLSEESKKEIHSKLVNYNIGDAKIEISQGFSTNDNNSIETLKNKISSLTYSDKAKQEKIDSLLKIPVFGKQILWEINQLFPSIASCSYSDTYEFTNDGEKQKNVTLVVLTIKGKSLSTTEKKKIENWLKVRLNSDAVRLYYDYKRN
jgi:uncharacterized hydrophobic protein (TIGR00271 family)